MSEHPSLQLVSEKEAKERETIEKALLSLNKPLDLKEITDKLARVTELHDRIEEQVKIMSDKLSSLEQKEERLLDLMIKRYEHMEG